MKTRSSASGTAIITVIVIRSRRPQREAARGGATGGASLIESASDEDRLGLLLQRLAGGLAVLVVDELLQGVLHHGGGEVRPGVAVEELRDVRRVGDDLGRVLLQLVVGAL